MDIQVKQIIGDLSLHELRPGRLAVVRKVKEVNHTRLLLEDCLPAEIDNALKPEGLVILLPSMSDEDGVRLRQGNELELCAALSGLSVIDECVTEKAIRTGNGTELFGLKECLCDTLALRLGLPLDISESSRESTLECRPASRSGLTRANRALTPETAW